EDYLKEGDRIRVKVNTIDDRGKIDLVRPELEGKVTPRSPRRGGGGSGGGSRGGGRFDRDSRGGRDRGPRGGGDRPPRDRRGTYGAGGHHPPAGPGPGSARDVSCLGRTPPLSCEPPEGSRVTLPAGYRTTTRPAAMRAGA